MEAKRAERPSRFGGATAVEDFRRTRLFGPEIPVGGSPTVQCNVKVPAATRDRFSALADEQHLAKSRLFCDMVETFDQAYAFRDQLTHVACSLDMSASQAVVNAVRLGIEPLSWCAEFFAQHVKASPGQSVSEARVCASFDQWLREQGLSEVCDSRALKVVGPSLCAIRQIKFRMRQGVTYLVDVRVT